MKLRDGLAISAFLVLVLMVTLGGWLGLRSGDYGTWQKVEGSALLVWLGTSVWVLISKLIGQRVSIPALCLSAVGGCVTLALALGFASMVFGIL